MLEEVVRLRPTFSTLRDLFAHSGNECAFSDCDRRLVNQKGQWVGEVCHIYAALRGGERFNESMTNQERRERENLMLMCHDHHVETDDEHEFPAEHLIEMKRAHEARFAGGDLGGVAPEDLEGAVDQIIASTVEDLTDRVVLHLPSTLSGFNEVLALEYTDEMLTETLHDLDPLLRALRTLPVDARALFAVMVARSLAEPVQVPAHELAAVTPLTQQQVMEHSQTLEKYAVARVFMEGEDDLHPDVPTLGAFLLNGWDFWGAVKSYCEETGVDAKEMIKELRFDWLDETPESAGASSSAKLRRA